MDNPYLIIGGAIAIAIIAVFLFNAVKGRAPRAAVPRPQPSAGRAPALSRQVQELASDPSRKISAIKAYRQETGLGLKEAKDAVEAWIASGGHAQALPQGAAYAAASTPGGASPSSALSQHVMDVARNPGGKIAAIKAYREETGAGLKEAKDAVEAWRRAQGLE